MSDEKKSRFHERLCDPVLALLQQGLTPEEVALALAVGAGLGVFPVPGVTTALCVLAGLAPRRLNPVALQVANYAVWPLQLLLLFPFFRMGAALFSYEMPVSSLAEVLHRFDELGFRAAVGALWGAIWRAVLLWTLAAVPVVAALFLALRALTRSLARGLTVDREGR